MIRRGALTIAVLALGLFGATASAGAATLYTQVPNGSFTVPTFPSHDFANDLGDSVATDDFTVPPGEVWTLSEFQGFGGVMSGSGSDTATVTLYNDAAGAPGASFFSRGGIPVPGTCSTGGQCDVIAAVQKAPGLTPGTYWASVQTSGPYAWRWAAYPDDTGEIFGAPAHWRNPQDGFDTGCTAFRPLPECEGPLVTPEGHRDLLFVLEGSKIDSNFTVHQFRSQGNKIKLDASFNSPGQAVVSQAKKGAARVLASARKTVKKAKVNVAAAGLKALPIKLTKSARLRLARGKNLKLRVRVKFTATGGVPTSQVAKVKVISVRPTAGSRGFRLVG